MNRRQFLGTTAAALAAAPLSMPAVAQSESAVALCVPRKPCPLVSLILLSTSSHSIKCWTSLPSWVSRRWRWVPPVPMAPPHCPAAKNWSPIQPRPVPGRRSSDDRGIPVMTLSCHNNALYPDGPPRPARQRRNFAKRCSWPACWKIPTVVGFSGCPGGSENRHSAKLGSLRLAPGAR